MIKQDIILPQNNPSPSTPPPKKKIIVIDTHGKNDKSTVVPNFPESKNGR